MRRSIALLLTSLPLLGCGMMTEVAAHKVSRGIRYTLVGAAFLFSEAILEGWLDSETDDDRFSDHQLNRMGIERGSDRYERLVADDKNCEELENQGQ